MKLKAKVIAVLAVTVLGSQILQVFSGAAADRKRREVECQLQVDAYALLIALLKYEKAHSGKAPGAIEELTSFYLPIRVGEVWSKYIQDLRADFVIAKESDTRGFRIRQTKLRPPLKGGFGIIEDNVVWMSEHQVLRR